MSLIEKFNQSKSTDESIFSLTVFDTFDGSRKSGEIIAENIPYPKAVDKARSMAKDFIMNNKPGEIEYYISDGFVGETFLRIKKK